MWPCGRARARIPAATQRRVTQSHPPSVRSSQTGTEALSRRWCRDRGKAARDGAITPGLLFAPVHACRLGPVLKQHVFQRPCCPSTLTQGLTAVHVCLGAVVWVLLSGCCVRSHGSWHTAAACSKASTGEAHRCSIAGKGADACLG